MDVDGGTHALRKAYVSSALGRSGESPHAWVVFPTSPPRDACNLEDFGAGAIDPSNARGQPRAGRVGWSIAWIITAVAAVTAR
jgi:hypothetical protein